MKHRLVKYLIGSMIFLIIFPVVFICTTIIAEYLDYFYFPALPAYGTSIFKLFLLAVSMICAISLARYAMWRYSRKHSLTATPLNRRFVAAILLGYALTTVIGVPAVQNSNTSWAIQAHERIDAVYRNKNPFDRTYLAVPVLPFVVVTYHAYVIGPLHARGLWDVQIWYLLGVKRLFSFPSWVA